MKKILWLARNRFYDIYKDDAYHSVKDFMIKEFKINSYNLLQYLYEHFLKQASIHSNYDVGKNIRLEFEEFRKELNEKRGINKSFYFYLFNNYSEYYSLDLNTYLLLLKKGKRQEFEDFIEEKIKDLKTRLHLNNFSIGCLEYIKGNIEIASEQFQIAMDESKKALTSHFNIINKENESFYEQKINHIKFIMKLITFQKKINEYHSFSDVINDLNDILVNIDNNIRFNMWFISSEDLITHYINLFNFLQLFITAKKFSQVNTLSRTYHFLKLTAHAHLIT